MKKVIVCSLFFTAVLSGTSYAQNEGFPPMGGEGPEAEMPQMRQQPRQQMSAEQMAQRQTEQLTKKYGLDIKQQKKIYKSLFKNIIYNHFNIRDIKARYIIFSEQTTFRS